jgi:hypothetical protein
MSVLFLLIIFVLIAVALTVLLWVGSLFFQGYIYTEPSPELYWQAPAAGAALGVFFTFWCWLAMGAADPQDLAYDTLFRFSPQVEKYEKPAKRIWVERKNTKEPVALQRQRIDQTRYEYREVDTKRPYSPNNVQAILVEESNGEKVRLAPGPAREGSVYREFVAPGGWTMMEYESGPTGQLIAFRFGRFMMNLLLNFVHLVVWFLCLWLLLRFTWAHALGFAFVLWLVTTLALLPMMLDGAANVGTGKSSFANRHDSERFFEGRCPKDDIRISRELILAADFIL